jgi:serine/threonine protein kinase
MPPSDSAPPAGLGEFTAPARYQLLRRLGAGGYGVVYAALDRETGARVALKTLRDLGPEALYRFKREFRALADVRHENLVRLFDLVSEGDQWCFTMELVEGVDFREAVSVDARVPGAIAGPASVDFHGRTMPITPAGLAALARPALPASGRPLADITRLRPALRQLAAGVVELHRRGMQHRDLKPSNVLVTAAGRVVILDFGLVAEQHARRSDAARVVGTVEYMAPEQASGSPTSPASDWYSVGIMLFEALTGRLPFTGNLLEMLSQRIVSDAPSVRSLSPDAPPDLATLCMALLAREPEDRPRDDEVLALLQAERGALPSEAMTLAPSSSTTMSTAMSAALIGRGVELAELGRAFAHTRSGSAAVTFLHGASGLGRSALLDQFRAELEYAATPAVVLAGRCHERESVPYKGVDSLIDALARDLRERPDPEIEALCPPQLHSLARLFPVLRRVPAIARVRPGGTAPGLAPHEQRQQAFEALRALLGRLAAAGPLVLTLDDLHWGDVDSVALLRELLRPPDPPPLLLIVSYRSDATDSGCIAALRAALQAHPGLQRSDLELRPLAPDAALQLARALLADSSRIGEAAAIARESGGSPLVITELCHFTRDTDARALGEAPTFEAVLRRRIAGLDPATRALLEVVAVAAEPIDPELAIAVARHHDTTATAHDPLAVATHHDTTATAHDTTATAQRDDDLLTTITVLRRDHLLRSHRVDGRTTVEAFHDRVRAALVEDIAPPRQRAIHRALAEALERRPDPDPDRLRRHFEAAGEPARAARHALEAAARATAALAFDRAAALYRVALAHADADERPRLERLLGDALADDGRGVEAAEAYLRAAERLEGEAALDLLRRAGFERLRSGQIDEGTAVLQRVLASVGMRLSATRGRALLSLLRHRVALTLRGLRFRERSEAAIPPALLRRVDVAWSIGASGLGMVDDLAAGEFQSLALRLALRAGEPLRICRALAGEVAFSAVGGTRSQRRTARLLHTARTLAERLDLPQARGTVAMTAGIAAYLEGRFADAASACAVAEPILRSSPGGAWDLINAQLFGLQARVYLGELAVVGERLDPLLREAERRGNLYLLASLRNGPTHLLWLARGALAEAQAGIDEAARLWSTRGMQVQHYWQLHARCDLDLYRGDPQAARDRLHLRWPDLGNLLRIQHVRIEALHLRGRCVLAAAASDPSWRRRVLADARAIAAERTTWGDGLAQLLRAGVAARTGDLAAARMHLAEAVAGCEPAGMALYTAAARRRRGELGPEPGGADWRGRADTWLSGQGVADIPRLLATLVPGFPDAPAPPTRQATSPLSPSD